MSPGIGMPAAVRNRYGVLSRVEPNAPSAKGLLPLVLVICADRDESRDKIFVWERDPCLKLIQSRGLPPVSRVEPVPLAQFNILGRATRRMAVKPHFAPTADAGPLRRFPMASPLKGAIEVKGHDTRTRRPKQVAARLGERFHPWQLEGTVEESWEECRRHAENLRLIRSISTPVAPVQQSQSQAPTVTGEPPVLRDLLEDRIETDLFGSKMPRLSRRPRRM